MSRKYKNIIMVVLALGLLVGAFFTVNYAKSHIGNGNQFQNMNGDMPIDMNGEEPPEMPNEENNNMDEKSLPDENNEMSEPPEKPDGEDNNAPSGDMENNDMPYDNGVQMDIEASGLTYGCYIAFIMENLILSGLVMYLVMSKFNKKTFKETLSNNDKKVIMVLAVIILTSLLTYVDVVFAKNNYMLSKVDDMSNGMEGSNNKITYSSSKEINEDTTITGGEYTSTTVDENALLVSGNIEATISNINVDKTGDSDGGDDTSFYGINSAIIGLNGANLTLKNITVTTNASGANGVFSYGGTATTNNSSSDGTTVVISDSEITTLKDNSGGLMTTGGGVTKATNLIVNTAGISSAAIRTDRGGGTVIVSGGTYTTTGAGSPTIYSTADITVSDAKLISKMAEGIVIEGKNSVLIDNCELNDSNTKLNGQSTTYKNIFLYQSMSGDAASGSSEFTAKNSKIITNNGDTLYVTNTTANINLENNTITNNDSEGNFLRVQKDSWGNSGSNGGDVVLTMTNQNAVGSIAIDSISTLDMSMKTNSYYEGTINGNNSAKSISLKLDKTSKIKLTGNSYVTSLENSDTSNSNINFNGYKLYVNGETIN
jgi:hypothetical protein